MSHPQTVESNDPADLRRSDLGAAKAIAFLTGGIFITGVVLYTTVALSVWANPPLYETPFAGPATAATAPTKTAH
jgi:hypothetical protein